MTPDGVSLNDVSIWVTVITGPLTVLGIGLAWIQLRRTADAAEATKDAVETTAKNMALYQLLVLLPQMQQHEAELDAAVDAKDARRVIGVLNEWRRTGTEVRGLLDSRPQTDADLLQLLQESFTDAYGAKRALLADSDPGFVTDATATVRDSVAKVSVLVGALTGQLKANVGGTIP